MSVGDNSPIYTNVYGVSGNVLKDKTAMPASSFYRLYDSMAAKPQIYKTVTTESKSVSAMSSNRFRSP